MTNTPAYKKETSEYIEMTLKFVTGYMEDFYYGADQLAQDDSKENILAINTNTVATHIMHVTLLKILEILNERRN